MIKIRLLFISGGKFYFIKMFTGSGTRAGNLNPNLRLTNLIRGPTLLSYESNSKEGKG